MRSMRLLGSLLAVGLMVGCQAKNGAKAPPATEETIREARENFKKLDPATRVGLVIAAKPELHLVAVGDVDVQDFNVGDSVTFTDSNRAILANGVIVRKTDDALHVRYDEPVKPARAPQAGDLAVRLVK